MRVLKPNHINEKCHLSEINLRHYGINVTFKRIFCPVDPYRYKTLEYPDHNALILDFSDIREVDALIEALTQFRDGCEGHIGKWLLEDAPSSNTSQDINK